MADLTTHMIEFPTNGSTTRGYLARPTYGGPHRSVVLVSESWRLEPHIEEVARRFARAGFVALAPDLFHDRVATEPGEAQTLAGTPDNVHALHQIAATARYLKQMEQVQPKWSGVIGWSLGGGLAISAAGLSGDFAAAIAFYGWPADPELIPRLQAPLLCLYAENDPGIPLEWVWDFDRQLASYHIPHETVVYPGVGHSFFNDTRHADFSEAAARDAWDRALAWLRRYLG